MAEKLLDQGKVLLDRIRTGNIVAAEELEMKSLSVNKTLVIASGFWPDLTVPQSQNPRRSAATPMFLFNRHDQIHLKIQRDP
jgi:hypothetical protein